MDGGMTHFHPPLILHATSRSRLARWCDAGLTGLLWLAWLYLLLAAVGALWVPPFAHLMLPVEPPRNPWQVVHTAVFLVSIAVLLCALMLLRVVLERRRFAGEDRRRGFPPPNDDAIAADFGIDTASLPAWRAARRLVVHHDATGRVSRVETCD